MMMNEVSDSSIESGAAPSVFNIITIIGECGVVVLSFACLLAVQLDESAINSAPKERKELFLTFSPRPLTREDDEEAPVRLCLLIHQLKAKWRNGRERGRKIMNSAVGDARGLEIMPGCLA